ncbi:DMP19 family protein [Sinorhizobium fredii]|uniref:DUF4375 domain-containing protein n=1 Tax=Rhizobium fredii TaxID=380 RepID=A0A2A6LT94_RHIFR|nr:DUF4375 domain-containing protein [Sinorhizobium fredii]ASY67787.1 hypothetical protein SF83666_c03430 [Sinorhizobium fredii CCBAU 83666]PDT45557.1 DUF4375 domain-containing protein [Sinorhizobium fredii]
MFGKRKVPPVPAFAVPVSNGLVVDSNHIAIDLVATVVDFVNYLFAHGLYRSEELPLHLMQLYHADFYVTQVNNGGHSQFIHNCGARAQTIFINAQAGLSAMGAIHQADLIRELAVWAAANPDKASAQTGFAGGRDRMLDRLDTLFAEVQANDPATRRAAAWIRTWPDVRFTEPAELRAAWNQSALTNPKRSHRLSKARVKAFQQTLSDSVHLAIGLAADEADETLFEGRSAETIGLEGRHLDVWIVQTSYGLRGAACDSNGVRLFALNLRGGGVTWTAVSLIGSAVSSDVDRMLSFVKREPVAAAADLLLSRAKPAITDCIIQPCNWADGIPNPIFKLSVGDEMFMMTKGKTGYVLAGQKPGEIYDTVSFAEVATHERSVRDN